MAVPDINAILAFLPYIQILVYVLWSLFFGSIAITGYPGYLPVWIKWPLRLGLGFIALVTGTGIGTLIPLAFPFASFVQMSIGCLISAIVLAIAVKISMHRMPWVADGFRGRIRHYQNKVKKLKSGGPLKAITPLRITGMAVLIALVVFGLAFFRGFPSFANEINSMIASFGAGMVDMDSVLGGGIGMILLATEIFMFIGVSMFFGSIALNGYRGYLGGWVKWPAKLGIGALGLVAGIGVGAFVPVAFPFASFVQMFIGGIIAGITLAVAIYILSYRMPGLIESHQGRIRHYQERLRALESGGPLKAITPLRITGMAVLIALVVFGLLNFGGFVTLENEASALIGDMIGIDIDMEDISADCQAMMNTLYANINALSSAMPSPYNDPALQTAMEQGCGESITGLFIYNLETPVVVGTTSNSNIMCLATQTDFCMRLDLSTLAGSL